MVRVSGTEPKKFGWILHFKSRHVSASSVNGGRFKVRRLFLRPFLGRFHRIKSGLRVNQSFNNPDHPGILVSESESQKFGLNIII